jgi:hypothetical protein
VVEELALKLLQRLNHAAQVMKQSADHLHEGEELCTVTLTVLGFYGSSLLVGF